MSEDKKTHLTIEELFSRERLADLDPQVLGSMVCVDIGAGAAGNNIMLNLALLGVGEARIVDLDRIDRSNYARSPGFAMVDAPVEASKAQTLARACAKLNPRPGALVRYANATIEELGLGAFKGSTVAVSAADSKEARAYAADVTRLLGVPLVEVGFRYPRAHVSIYGNRRDSAPCWRCREPEVTTDRVSCSLYARRAVEAGRTPATQPLAAVVGAFAAEACVRLAHGDSSLDDTFVDIDLRTFSVERMSLAAADSCPGVHLRASEPVELELDHRASVEALLTAVGGRVTKPVLKLLGSYLVAAPCARCGARVHVGLPSRAIKDAPVCAACPDEKASEPSALHRVLEISPEDRLRSATLRRLGYRPGDVVTVIDEASDRVHVFRLQGGPDALFQSVRARGVREGSAPRAHDDA